MIVLLLLNTLIIIIFRRRGGQRGGLRLKLSRVIRREPNTPNLPMQLPPPWGMSPQTPEGPKPFLHPSDLEKGVGSLALAPKGFEAKYPFAVYRVGLPSVPEMGVMRAGNDDCQSGSASVKLMRVCMISDKRQLCDSVIVTRSSAANGRRLPNSPTYF